MGVAQHVGVAAPGRGRGHDARAADHPAVAQHQRVVRAGIVVLVHLDVVVVRDVPAELVDEERLPQPQVLVKRRAVPVLAQEIEGNGMHDSLSRWRAEPMPVAGSLLIVVIR